MDNLSAHKRERVKELIERRDCELLYLLSYSPDFNPPLGGFLEDQTLLTEG
jgi:transposase